MGSRFEFPRRPLALRRFVGRTLGGLRTASYIRKWLVLGCVIGVIAGLGAVAFLEALHLATYYLLGHLGSFFPATTAGEGGPHIASALTRPWAIPLVVALGGLVSGVLVFGLAPEAEGHGTDAAIDTVHNRPKGMRSRVTVVKMVASAITIGSGGSGGREGPTAQISASFGSILARALNLTPADARIAVAAGIAAGIGAIFRAPRGGAVLGAELLYRDDMETAALMPSLVASIVAFAVFGSVEGFAPIFGFHTGFTFQDPAQLGWYALLGIVAGLMGRLYAYTFYSVTDAFRHVPLHRMAKPAIAGFAVGLIGLLIPGVLGTGYGAVQEALDRSLLLAIPLWMVLLLPFAKILATSLSIGSGGSGGIFGPGMVIGGATGAALWRLLEPVAPAMPGSPVPFVIVGMMACFGAVAHAPLAVMLMVAEMTGNLALLAPAMIAVALAVFTVGETTIYRSQLRDRSDSPAYRLQFGLTVAALPIHEVMAPPRLVLRADTSLAEARERLRAADLPGAPVVDERNLFVGLVQRSEIEASTAGAEHTPMGRLANAEAMTLAVDATLEAAMEALAETPEGWVTVLDSDMRVAGILSVSDLVRGYRLALRQVMRRLGLASAKAILVEDQIQAGSPLDGCMVGELHLPRGTVIMALQREEALHFVNADTTLQAGDRVSAIVRPDGEATLRALFTAPAGAPAVGVGTTGRGV